MKTEPGYLLIVEDDPDILALLDTTLTFRGYRVITASNGKEGLEAIQKEHPSVIIADIMMPQLDGFGLVHRLRITPETREIPVVFITATYVTPEDREFALNIGVTRFMEKPLDLEKFLGTINELLRGKVRAPALTFSDFNFYEAYRKRLEAKLAQKNKQIARDERMVLTAAQSGEEHELLLESLHQAMKEREELKLLLNQIHTQLDKLVKPE